MTISPGRVDTSTLARHPTSLRTSVRWREVARIARLHPELSPQAIEDLTRGLVNQIFPLPSERLRAIDDAELGERFADLFSATEGSQP